MIALIFLCLSAFTGDAAEDEDIIQKVEEKGTYILTVQQGEQGRIEIGDPSGTVVQKKNNSYEVIAGTVLTISVHVNEGYSQKELKANGLLVVMDRGQAAYSMPEKNVTLEAVFENKKSSVKTEDEIVEDSEEENSDIDSEISGLNKNLLCDEPDCLEKHVGKTLAPGDVTGILEGLQKKKRSARLTMRISEPYLGMTTSGSNADVTFLGSDPNAPGDFSVSFNDGDYLDGVYVEGMQCLNHGAANPGTAGAVQCTYEAEVVDIDKEAGSVTWDVVVTPPGACVEGSVLGYQRVGGILSTSWSYTQYGSLEINKKSNNPDLTKDNPCYSLEGAEFEIYTQGTNEVVTTISTDKNGYGKADKLEVKTYDIRETKAPKGFALDSTRHSITIKEGVTTTYEMTDKAQNDPVSILLGKVDAQTNANRPEGSASLENAEFTIKYFKGFYNVDPETQGVSAERVWVMKTDSRGFTRLGEKYKVSGDDLYFATSGDPTVPMGTLTLQETKAPTGYIVNSEVFVRQITSNGPAESVATYNQPIIPEQVIRGGVYVEKWDTELNRKSAQGGASLLGAKIQLISLNDNSVLVEGVEYQKDQVITTLTTDKNGAISIAADYLPWGDYKMVEKSPPPGYLNSGVTERTFQIRENGKIVQLNTQDTAIKDKVIRGGVYVEKWDNELNQKNPQGGASLEGGKIQLISLNENPVLVEGREYQKDQVVTILTTDANGAVSVAADYLPWGDYKMSEQSPPPGYLNSGVTERTFQIRENGKIVQLNTTDTAIKDNVIRGGVKIQKWDSETNQNKPQGSASLQGAEFQLITLNDNPVLVESKTYSKNEVIKKFTTDKNGTIQVDGNYLPKGKYRWIEVKPPNGYNLTGTLQRDFEIKENGKIVQMTTSSTAIKNDIIRGDLQLVKFRESQDEDEDQKTPLDGITFTLTSKESGDKFEIVTDKNGYANTKQLGISSRGNLVYGNYTVHESNTPVGLKPIKDFDITINKEGQTLYYILEDKLIMSPVQFIKADATTGKLIPFAGAEFQLLDKDKKPITMTTHYPNTVVHYTFKTDESGSFVLPEKLAAGSYYWREIMAPDGYQRNPNDMKFSITDGHDWQDPFVVEFTDTPAMGKIKIVKTDETTGKAIAGTVFEIKAKEDIVTPDGTVRLKKGEVADTITTDANGLAESKKLFLGWYITAEKKQTPGFVLSDKTYDVKLKYKDQETSVVLGEVEISNLPTFAQLVKMDSKTKEPLQGVTFDVWNNAMLEEPDAEGVKKETYTTDEEGLIQLKYLVPGTYCFQEVKTLPGYVLNEKVFSMVIDKDGRVNGEDIGVLEVENTLTQLLGTKARDKDTGTQEAIAKRDTTTIDTIDFKSLQIGAEYTIEGILMEQATNKPVVIDGKVVTAEKKFIPDTTNESADVVFNYDASGLKGKTIVVFEKVFVEGKEILAHEDINDKEQAIHFPEVKIKTTMLDQDTGTHEAVAKKDAVHIDTVKYEGAIAKLEYIIKGILMDSATGKPVMENGKTVTAETTVTPKEKNGSVDLKYTYDASAQKGRAVVSFVKMYYKDTEVGSHEAINDKGQTVVFPKGRIKTTAKGKDTGTKEVIAKKDAVIVDAVFYEDLIVGQPHNLRGILMEQDTGKPLLIDNKEVTAEKEFIPKEKKGTVELEFSFNASGLKNKKLVVFEKVYVGETEVAAHEDINDEDQTVIIKLGKLSVNMPNLKNNGLWTSIKTGDTSAIFPVLLGVISSLSLAIGMSVYWKRRRQKNEEE